MFIAFSITDINFLKLTLKQLNLNFKEEHFKYASLLSFEENSEYYPIFFIEYENNLGINSNLFTHENGSTGIESIWLNLKLKKLFQLLDFNDFKTEIHHFLGESEMLKIGKHRLFFSNFNSDSLIGLTLTVNKKPEHKIINHYGIYLEFLYQ